MSTPTPTIEVTRSDSGLPQIDVRQFLDEDLRAGLVLDGTMYLLRVTRNGKLILTK